MSGPLRVGFVGLGRMGLAMARNVAAAGHPVVAWNRSPVAADAVAGARIVAEARAAFEADVVFTLLADDAAILDAGLLAGVRPGVVHVVSATISTAFADELAVAHAAAGVGFVCAPVFGRPEVAAAAALNIMAAGAPEALAVVAPVFEAIGQRVFVMGARPSQASAAKIAGNMMLAMAIEAMAEAFALTDAQGVAREAFLDLMLQTQFDCRAYRNYGGKILAGDFEAGFRLALGLKDLRLATAGQSERLPMLAALEGQMARAAATGLADRDWSAVAQLVLGEG